MLRCGLWSTAMEIEVNGKAYQTREGAVVLDVIQSLDLDPARVVAELNSEIIPGESFGSRRLEPGDRLELVGLVGGG